MALRFIAIDPGTDEDHSPTIWLEEETGDLIIQSYKADAATLEEVERVGSVPGHATDVPAHETVIRLPARMRPFIPGVEEAPTS
ncbi:hypothetical protein [Jiangella rhizosphaerae]|uniref:Uncharacterized protein n=1 Tax=Jiangella rhizosphaerae TaxID=2293569 RepID=A0A418KHK3_9ACTN|nr:hypothetical protein DY240_27930 [Jiangella rhizosphaerae]